jgi:uncharacterized membrane protein YpjA
MLWCSLISVSTRRLKMFERKRWLIPVLLLSNFAGLVFGVSSYWSQLEGRSVLEWFLIADCPVAVLLFMLILFLVWFGKKVPALLADFTFIYLIKNALLTLLVFLLYSSSFDISFSIIASLAHVFMVLQSFLLVPFLSSKPFSLLFLVFLDFSDFFLGTLYYIPSDKHLRFVYYFSLSINLVLFFFKNWLVKLINR